MDFTLVLDGYHKVDVHPLNLFLLFLIALSIKTCQRVSVQVRGEQRHLVGVRFRCPESTPQARGLTTRNTRRAPVENPENLSRIVE